MEKINVAILAGGFDAERVISLKSASVVKKHLDTEKYNSYIIDIDKDTWFEQESTSIINKDNFSVIIREEIVKFDVCFMAIHGSPAEDGKIQGYFEMLKIPYTGCNGVTSAITMNKTLTKQIAKSVYNITTANFINYSKGDEIDIESIEKLGYPMFIKPNSVGSSFGVTKVKERAQIEKAIKDALLHDNKVIIEEFIEGREFSHGIFQENESLHIMPITEIISENEFFDYEAKYEGKSKEITPAVLSDELTVKCQEISKFLFQIFECKGLTRFDYLLRKNEFYFIEANTLPGLSEASIFPQQLNHYGISLSKAFDILIQNALIKQ